MATKIIERFEQVEPADREYAEKWLKRNLIEWDGISFIAVKGSNVVLNMVVMQAAAQYWNGQTVETRCQYAKKSEREQVVTALALTLRNMREYVTIEGAPDPQWEEIPSPAAAAEIDAAADGVVASGEMPIGSFPTRR